MLHCLSKSKTLVPEPTVRSSSCCKIHLPCFSTDGLKSFSLLRYLYCLLFLNSGSILLSIDNFLWWPVLLLRWLSCQSHACRKHSLPFFIGKNKCFVNDSLLDAPSRLAVMLHPLTFLLAFGKSNCIYIVRALLYKSKGFAIKNNRVWRINLLWFPRK